MAQQIKLFRLFVAAPSDVEFEQSIIREVVTEWNIQNGQMKKTNIEVVSWHTHSYPAHGDRPQALINRQVFDSSDIVVGVFWTHFGSPTGVADSGTEEEIKRGILQKKKVMVYFSDAPVPPSKLDADQFHKINGFRKEYEGKGLYFLFKSQEEFRGIFRQHLAALMNDLAENNEKDKSAEGDDTPISIPLPIKYWTVILAGLEPLVEVMFKAMDDLRQKKIDPKELPEAQVTALTGPLITRGIIIDELYKLGLIKKEGKESIGLETIIKKLDKS